MSIFGCTILLLSACSSPVRPTPAAADTAAAATPAPQEPAPATPDPVAALPEVSAPSPAVVATDPPPAAPVAATPTEPPAVPTVAIPATPPAAPAPTARPAPAAPTAPRPPAPSPAPTAVAPAPTTKPAPAPAPPPAARPATPAVVTSASLRGTVQLRPRAGQTLAADEVRDTVLWFAPNRPVATRPGRFVIQTRNKRFEPRTLVVPVGSTVDFPNSDPVIHNVFSLAPGNEFDLGLYGEGESAETVLSKPGVVMAFCNVHYSMFAALLVVETPFTAQVGADGRFQLDNLPAGGGVLHVWHPRAEGWTQSLILPSPAPLDIQLAIVKTLIPQHTSKTGGSYRPAR